MTSHSTEKIEEYVRAAFLETPLFDHLEDFIARWSELAPPPLSTEEELRRHASALAAADETVASVAKDLIQTKNAFMFTFFVLDAKILLLVKSLIFTFNSQNTLLMALASRSLLEHAASLSYLTRRTATQLDVLQGVATAPGIAQALGALRETCIKLFYGTRLFKRPGLVDAVNVLTLIDNYLAKDISDARDYYDYLSDFVHPNFASNLLVSAGQLGEGAIGPSVGETKLIIDRIVLITDELLHYTMRKGFDFAWLGSRLHDYLGRAISPGTRLDEIFVEHPLKWQGDGRSKDSAIFFLNARTHGEHLEMQGRFLADMKIRVIGPRRNAGIEAGHVFDVYPTEGGDLWFRVPLPPSLG